MRRGDPLLLAGPAADAFAEAWRASTWSTTSISRPSAAARTSSSMKIRELVGTRRRGERGREAWHGRRRRAATQDGHLAAATSTGGYTNKPSGRVGDSPIIGAGTYARDGRCAVSGTGKGEYLHPLLHRPRDRVADGL